MESVGHLYRVVPGMAEEYARRHAATPPELDALLREAGVRRYAIYASGEDLFSHMEVEDYPAMVARYDGDPAARAWGREMDGLIENPHRDPGTGWPTALRLVWEL